MTPIYRYYCADTDDGKHFCLMASDDIEAAYRATHIAKWHWNTTLTDIYLDKYHHYNEERISKQLQHDKEISYDGEYAYKLLHLAMYGYCCSSG